MMGAKSKSKLNQVIDEIHFRIETNQDILKLLHFDAYDTDIYNQPNLSSSVAQKINDERIHDKKKKPLDSDQTCYIAMWYGRKAYYHEKNQFFNGNNFHIVILCHNDIIINRYVGDRTCEIENIIADLFDNQSIGTACRCKVVSSEDVDIKGVDYSGRHIILSFADFNGVDRYE